MDRRGVKRRRVHRSYCPRPIRTRRLSARPPCPPALPRNPRGGKIPHGGGAAVFSRPAKTFKGRGEGRKESPQAQACPPARPSVR